MRQSLIFILSFLLLGTRGLFAADETDPVVLAGNGKAQTYESYDGLLDTQCSGSDKAWNKAEEGGTIVTPPVYAELLPDAIKNSISQTASAKNLPSEQSKLIEELNRLQNEGLPGLKSVELARIQYRSAMNSIFACAVIDSRIQILADLQKKIEKSYPGKKTEIMNKLDREAKKLREVRKSTTCNTKEGDSNKVATETRITNSVTKQYCHFTFYVGYLRDNLEKNNNQMMEIEKKIGIGNKDLPINTDDWHREYTIRMTQLDTELTRASSALPLALRTFQEMKRTYALHIMLTIVYDDYVNLRESLNRYFNITSQFFEKVYNAMKSSCYN